MTVYKPITGTIPAQAGVARRDICAPGGEIGLNRGNGNAFVSPFAAPRHGLAGAVFSGAVDDADRLVDRDREGGGFAARHRAAGGAGLGDQFRGGVSVCAGGAAAGAQTGGANGGTAGRRVRAVPNSRDGTFRTNLRFSSGYQVVWSDIRRHSSA